jgi:hypothetical protein
MRPWGFWGTVAISAYTIAFDIWGLAAIAPSAAAGIIPAVVLIVYLILMKDAYLGTPRRIKRLRKRFEWFVFRPSEPYFALSPAQVRPKKDE